MGWRMTLDRQKEMTLEIPNSGTDWVRPPEDIWSLFGVLAPFSTALDLN